MNIMVEKSSYLRGKALCYPKFPLSTVAGRFSLLPLKLCMVHMAWNLHTIQINLSITGTEGTLTFTWYIRQRIQAL